MARIHGRRWWTLVLWGAWLPVVVTCQPLDVLVDVFSDDGVLVVDGPRDYYVVDDWRNDDVGFDFWFDHWDDD